MSLARTHALLERDNLFQADPPRVIKDMTCYKVWHRYLDVHPIFLLLENPWGIIISKLVASKIVAAEILNSFIGALEVTVGFSLFYYLSSNLINSFLLSGIFGFSMSQLFFSVIPETYSLAALSLIATYYLSFFSWRRKKINLILWILAGIFSLGVTTTNFVQTFICFLVLLLILKDENQKNIKNIFKRITFYLIVVLGITMLLSLIQTWIYPRTPLFFWPNSDFSRQFYYLGFSGLKKPLQFFSQMFMHFFMVNFVAPKPMTFFLPHHRFLAVTFANSWNYSFLGWLGLSLWLFFLVKSFLKNIPGQKTPLFIAFFFCLLFNMVFHSFYGYYNHSQTIEFFLYSENFTFLVLLFLKDNLFEKKFFTRFLLFLLMLFFLLNNFMVLKIIEKIY